MKRHPSCSRNLTPHNLVCATNSHVLSILNALMDYDPRHWLGDNDYAQDHYCPIYEQRAHATRRARRGQPKIVRKKKAPPP